VNPILLAGSLGFDFGTAINKKLSWLGGMKMEVSLSYLEWNLIRRELRNRLDSMETELSNSKDVLDIYKNRYDLSQNGALDFINDPIVRIELKGIDPTDSDAIQKKLQNIIDSKTRYIQWQMKDLEGVKKILKKYGDE
jgi:hypothetical protein